MYPPMTAEGLGVLYLSATYIGAVVSNFAVVKLRYRTGLGVPIVPGRVPRQPQTFSTIVLVLYLTELDA